MFGLGFGEVTIILILALIFLGPKRLPEVGKKVGEFYRQFRDITETVRGSVTGEFEEPSITIKDNQSQAPTQTPSLETKVPGPPAAGLRESQSRVPDQEPEGASDKSPVTTGKSPDGIN